MSRPPSQQDVRTLIRRFSDLSSMSTSDTENVIPHPLSTVRKLSPGRRPLHERSRSETNERPGPTIRIVDDSDEEIYRKPPFPSQASQVLPPRKTHRGYAFDGRGSPKPRVSDSSSTTMVSASEAKHSPDTLVPKPLNPKRRSERTSGSTYTSDTDTVTDVSSFTPATRFSQDTSPPSSPKEKDIHDSGVGGLGILHEEVPASTPPTVRAVIPSASLPPAPTSLSQPISKASLTSSQSTDTLILHYSGDERSGSSSSNLAPPPGPISQPKKPKYSYPRSKKRAGSARVRHKRPAIKSSSESLAESEKSRASSDYPPSSSQSTAHVAFPEPAESSSSVQYPTVRPAQASGSHATTTTLPKTHTTRMTDRLSGHQWSSQLSIINSESNRDSQSPSQASMRSPDLQRIATLRSTTSFASVPEEDDSLYLAPPELAYAPIRPADWRDSDELHDTVTELQPHIVLKKQHSGRYLRRFSSDSRPTSRSSSRPSSAGSNISYFVASTIPAWAQYYYRRGEDPALATTDSEPAESRRQSMLSDMGSQVYETYRPVNIYRPRNRARQQEEAARDSLVITEAPPPRPEQNVYIVGRPRRLRSEPFTPRLMRDRRSAAALSPWPAPSFDSNYGTLAWTRGNRQVLMFIIGFVFPPAWLVAGFLPLPEMTSISEKATRREKDIEAQFAQSFGPEDEYRYLKARWWRNLNRIMSVVGVALIVTIIVLAVVASRML